MAKKKAKKKKGGKRRVGAAGGGNDTIMMALGVAGGAIVANVATTEMKKKFTDMDDTLAAGLPAAVGAAGLLFGKKVKMLKSPIVKGFALGLVAGGAVQVAKELKVIGEIAPPVYTRRIAGPNQVPAIGQPNKPYNNVPAVGLPGNPNAVPAIGINRSRRRYAGSQ